MQIISVNLNSPEDTLSIDMFGAFLRLCPFAGSPKILSFSLLCFLSLFVVSFFLSLSAFFLSFS